MNALRNILIASFGFAVMGFAFVTGAAWHAGSATKTPACPTPVAVSVAPKCACKLVLGGVDYGCLDTNNCARFRTLFSAMMAEIELLNLVAERCLKEAE